MKKIKFINPSVYLENDRLLKFKKVYIPGVQLLILAALTPPVFAVSYTDELVDDVNFDEEVDLVCLGLNTYQARRAYKIADEFRRRGKAVILGGIHASVLPEEAKEHAEAVVVGEAEEIWPEILADFEGGRLQPFYKPAAPPDLKKSVLPRLNLLNFKKCGRPPLSKMPVMPYDTSRGCPNQCEFCVIGPFHEMVRFKPVAVVVDELKKIGAGYYFFTDSNICINRNRAKELFRALIPLNIKWVSNFTIDAAEDAELLSLAARSGCISAYIGFESIFEENLKLINKKFTRAHLYADYIKRFHRQGLPIQASLIFGLDYDTEASIRETVDFVNANRIDKVSLYGLTPFPGTALYRRLAREGRIITLKFWLDPHCQVYDLHIRPKNFTRERLLEIFWESYQKIYTYRAIFKRLFLPPNPHALESLISNVITRRVVYKKQVTFS